MAMCALSLGDNVFVLPTVLLLGVVVSACLLCMPRSAPSVWWPITLVISVLSMVLALVPLWLFIPTVITSTWSPLLLAIYFAAAVLAGLVPWRHGWTYSAFMAVHVLLVGLVMQDLPVIADVQVLLEGGVDALLHGQDPYDITVPAVYEAKLDWIYGPGVLVDGRITYGYPYLPVPLLFVVPAFLLGDVRVALVLAMVATSWLIKRLAGDQLGRLCAVLVLILPVSWAMQLSYWVEPVLLLWVALMAFSMSRGRFAVAVWFGFFLASKQFAVVHLPYLWMLMRVHGRRAVWGALAVPAALCLVFLIWDPAAFWHSAVEFHLRQPYRYDTVTLTPALERLLGSSPDFLFGPYGLILGGLLSMFIAWRCLPSGSVMSAGIGLSLAVTVLFSKQGHPNYWGLIGGALLVAVASWSEIPFQDSGRSNSAASDNAEPIRTRR